MSPQQASAEPASDAAHDWVLPQYGSTGLGAVLPSVLASLGVEEEASAYLRLPAAERAVVVLVDGLGDRLLRRRSGHAPFLRSLLATGRTLHPGFPTTTATSMGSFGTGLPPGAHGLVGYEVRDPDSGTVFNELSWEEGPHPESWQPFETVFERAERAGLTTARIGPSFFDGSGLTRAALRGGDFVGANDLASRVDATLACAREPRSLTYLYWGEVDKVGHIHGCESWQWGEELSATDAELERLASSLPAGTALHITADHGMVDVPEEAVVDVALDPVLSAGLARFGGEPRAPQVYAVPGAAQDVIGRWQERLADRGEVLTRLEAVERGLFGPVREHVLHRIGDAVVLMKPGHAVVDSRVHRPELIALRGLHGSLTPDEVEIPLLSVPPAASSSAASQR
ncbi:MAG: alkaline phosphatase family protein [Actinomycetia bacterium]|nr:alkaline phosphatase family protein [Actinomycetes bacterium]